MNSASIYIANSEAEKQRIIKGYRSLASLLREKDSEEYRANKQRFKQAFRVAADAHKKMRRKSGDPYILHPIAVARIVIDEIGLGTEAAMVALLHDVVEDTEVKLSDIEQLFGAKIARMVQSLTKIKTLTNSKASTQSENLKKMLLNLVEDPQVILIKLADRLHNMRTMDSMTKEKRIKICSETMQFYVPIAHRLGLYSLKTELEDIAMMYLNSSAYNEIATRLRETKLYRNKFINQFIQHLKGLISASNYQIPCRISGRAKSIYSIYAKMQRRKISLEEVFDVFAIRIIIDAPPDDDIKPCWDMLFLLNKHFFIFKDRVRDWITKPKPNGYTALHTTVMDASSGKWVEIQIRSRRMDTIAENGIAAHFLYKEEHILKSVYDQWILKIRDLIHKNSQSNSVNVVQEFRDSLVIDEIFVFTPRGDVRSLPKKATVLDFAYEMHTRLGEQCIGAKVNNNAVSLETELYSGDRVEILTSHKQRPQEHHLHFLVLPKARKTVSRYLNKERRKYIKIGIQKYEEHLHKHKMFQKYKNYKRILIQKFSVPDISAFYAELGKGNIDLEQITPDFFQQAHVPAIRKQALLNIPSQLSGKNIQYAIATCCNPIKGDNIYGIINKNVNTEFLEVHLEGCKSAERTLSLYDCQVISLRWQEEENIVFEMNILIRGIDRRGIIYEIVKLISQDLGMDIGSIFIQNNTPQAHTFEMKAKLFVRNKDEWEKLITGLEKIEGIAFVDRLIDYPETHAILEKTTTMQKETTTTQNP